MEGCGEQKTHTRRFRGSELVYPVLSRRSRGISVGVNLNLDQNCNFRCLYCQVDGSESRSDKLFSLDKLETELPETLGMIQSGEIYQYDPFIETPEDLRHLRDIAISGDGEPTASQHFGLACEVVVRVKDQMGLEDVKLVLITNASLLHKEPVRRTLAMLYDHKLEVWGKLDAGTEEYYHLVNGSSIPFDRMLENLLATARVRPTVIQSLFAPIDV